MISKSYILALYREIDFYSVYGDAIDNVITILAITCKANHHMAVFCHAFCY